MYSDTSQIKVAHPSTEWHTESIHSIHRQASQCKQQKRSGLPANKPKSIATTTMLWIKALHLIFMVTWFAGLFYLPRLFVYHALSQDQTSLQRFKIMERKLFFGIMTPGAILTIIFGSWLIYINSWNSYADTLWLPTKIGIIILLIIYHTYCGKLLLDFKHDRNQHGHVFYRWLNELPVLALFIIVILAVVKPF
jgi:putative membrane protein